MGWDGSSYRYRYEYLMAMGAKKCHYTHYALSYTDIYLYCTSYRGNYPGP